MEQVILDLDIADNQQNLLKEIGENQFEESLDLIREKGIGGFLLTRPILQKISGNILPYPSIKKYQKHKCFRGIAK